MLQWFINLMIKKSSISAVTYVQSETLAAGDKSALKVKLCQTSD